MSIQGLKFFCLVCFGLKKKIVIHSKATHGLQDTPQSYLMLMQQKLFRNSVNCR